MMLRDSLSTFEPCMPKAEMVFFPKMRFCVQPLFRSYTLTYLGPTGQSPACLSSQVVPFLRLLKEKVRESQASIESVEAKSLCLLKSSGKWRKANPAQHMLGKWLKLDHAQKSKGMMSLLHTALFQNWFTRSKQYLSIPVPPASWFLYSLLNVRIS